MVAGAVVGDDTFPPIVGAALSPANLMRAALGSLLGTLVGVLPGLGPTTAIAILSPLTTVLAPAPAIIMLAGIYYGAMYGGFRLLAVLSPSRVKFLSDVLTAEEQGVMKGVRVQWWAGVAFPSATPDPIVKKWESAIAEMAKDPAFLAGADRNNMNIDFLNAADMRAFVEKEIEGYTDMAGKIGIRR